MLGLRNYNLVDYFSRNYSAGEGNCIFARNDLELTKLDVSNFAAEKDFEVSGPKLIFNNNYICGDFNVNFKTASAERHCLMNIMAVCGLNATVEEFTRVTQHSSSTIDNIFVNTGLDISVDVEETFLSDRRYIVLHNQRDLIEPPKSSKGGEDVVNLWDKASVYILRPRSIQEVFAPQDRHRGVCRAFKRCPCSKPKMPDLNLSVDKQAPYLAVVSWLRACTS